MPLNFRLFEPHPDLLYGFSERSDGPMKVKDLASAYTDRRRTYFRHFDISLDQVVAAYLTHGTNVRVVGLAEQGTLIPDADGLMTSEPGVVLSVTGADCFPVYAFDPVTQAVGLAHVGWKGAVHGIVPTLIEKMKDAFGCLSADVRIRIGPGLRACHFRIQDDIRGQFDPTIMERREGEWFVDLPKLIIRQLIEQGIYSSHIEDAEQCTYCLSDRYFSYRRDRPKEVEAMIAFIGLRTH